MYTVTFVGLNYFNACTAGQKEALIPNGIPDPEKPDDHIPQHNASVFIEASRYDSDNWWPNHTFRHSIPIEIKLGEFRYVEMIEFRIPKPVELNFRSRPGPLENVNLDEGLPKLQDVDGFVLDDHPDTIANIVLDHGELEVFGFGSVAVVRWLISRHKEPITITAFVGDRKHRVTLKQSDKEIPTEIVFANTVELLGGDAQNGNDHCHAHKSDGSDSDKYCPCMQRKDAHCKDPHCRCMYCKDPHCKDPHCKDPHCKDPHCKDPHCKDPHCKDPHCKDAHGGDTHGGDTHGGGGHGFAGHFVLYSKLDEERDPSKFENPYLPDFAHLQPLTFSHPYLAFLSGMEEVPDGACVPTCCG